MFSVYLLPLQPIKRSQLLKAKFTDSSVDLIFAVFAVALTVFLYQNPVVPATGAVPQVSCTTAVSQEVQLYQI